MPNVSFDIEQSLLNRLSEVALNRKTTVSAMVRSYLEQLAAREEMPVSDRIEKLRALFDAADAEVGPVTWTREDLHAR
jgi:antitoxin component of RelBE/YafQ-DinJ toxin-antitoxin module